MASRLPPFTAQQVERIARIVGETENGLSGQEIGRLLGQLGFPDDGPETTKWKRIFNSLAALQNKHEVGNHTVILLNEVMRPEAYLSKRDLFSSRQEQLNAVLSFAGYYVRDDGKVGKSQRNVSIDLKHRSNFN